MYNIPHICTVPTLFDVICVVNFFTPSAKNIHFKITNSNTLNAPATNSVESIRIIEDEKLELKEVTKTTSANHKAQALQGLNLLKSSLKWNRTARSFSIEDQAKINQYVGVLYRENPNSFEYNYWKFYASSYDVSNLKYIEKAAKIQATS